MNTYNTYTYPIALALALTIVASDASAATPAAEAEYDIRVAIAAIDAARADLRELRELNLDQGLRLNVSLARVREIRAEIGAARDVTEAVRARQWSIMSLFGDLLSLMPGGDLALGAILAALGIGLPLRKTIATGWRARSAGVEIEMAQPGATLKHNGNVKASYVPSSVGGAA